MSRLVFLHPDDPMPECAAGGVSAVEASERHLHLPDVHLLVIDEGGRLGARCSLWWSLAPSLEGQRVGVIGHYAAADDPLAHELLQAASARLAGADCTIAIGPMDGNTWRRYRFIVERGSEPPFFLEPDNDDRWPVQWRTAGFDVFTTYTSALAEPVTVDQAWLDDSLERLSRDGTTIRHFDPRQPEEELQCIYRLSLEGFRRNVLYTPLGNEEFLAQNRRLLQVLKKELVFIAERKGEPIGFLFALPDVFEAQRGQARTVILKTIAVTPAAAGAGLGGALIARALRDARGLGFERAFFALMHEDSVSQRISRRYAKIMRRYALFSKLLVPGGLEPLVTRGVAAIEGSSK
jgi:GNAT superfamily N-acetyltransferase